MVNLETLFPKILKPALGCTEPVAVGLAAAAAAQAAAGRFETMAAPHRPLNDSQILAVAVSVSRNVFKNAFSILIPNAEGHKGIVMSAALGALCNPALELKLFRSLDHPHILAANRLITDGKVTVDIEPQAHAELYIRATVDLSLPDGEHRGECLIRDRHSNIASLVRDRRELAAPGLPASLEEPALDEDLAELRDLGFEEIVPLAHNLPGPVQDLLRKAVELNTAACEAGLSQPLGLGTGFLGISTDETARPSLDVASLAAAGSDARMSGYPVEVMSSAGSGNQGIIATMPVVAYAREHGLEEGRTLEAVALSHLISMHLALHVGMLSALCGVAVKAGIGASCGLVSLMGGGPEEMERALKIMVATLSGMICDGAKAGCALKVSSSADMALRAAQLAMRRMEVPDDNGIVAPTADKTIRNLAALGQSMEAVDDKILAIMKAKIASN